ncbi:MAG TPA: sugar ABC transporter permease [Ruminiclostridium sp.]
MNSIAQSEQVKKIEKVRTKGFKNKNSYGYLFVLPFFILLLLFAIIPNIFTLFISFTKWNNYTDLTFVGLKNYIKIINDGLFFKSLFNTLRIMLISLPIGILLSLSLAFIIDQKIVRHAGVFKTLFFLPYITTPVAVGTLFGLLFDYQTGFINLILQKLGIFKEPVYWMSKPEYVVVIVSIIVLWKSFGYNMILYLAGLKTIPKELYEAADIDGANIWQKFFYISIPKLNSVTMFVVITSLIWGLQIFDEPALLLVATNTSASIASTIGGPGKSVYTLVSYVYEEGFILFREGMASAVSYLMTIVIVIFSIFSAKVLNKGEGES